MWTSPERKARLAAEEQMPLEQIQESKLLIKCFVSFCREQTRRDVEGNAQHIKLLFMMLSILSEHTLINYTFLKDFYLNEVAVVYTPQQKAACLAFFLTFFQQPATPQDDKVQALQLIVLPMLAASFQKGEAKEVLSADPNPNPTLTLTLTLTLTRRAGSYSAG